MVNVQMSSSDYLVESNRYGCSFIVAKLAKCSRYILPYPMVFLCKLHKYQFCIFCFRLKINNYEFDFVCQITPELETDGTPKKFFPQERYDNKKNLNLNKYGKGPFCKFSIDRKYSLKTGVYVILVDDLIEYAGECVDLFTRFGMGYGNISPRNCFEGGQSTNCRINSNILTAFKLKKSVQSYFLETSDRSRIEHELIINLSPSWNIKN